MLLRNKSIALLFAGQALYWGCSTIGITLTALVGLQLAPQNSLAVLELGNGSVAASASFASGALITGIGWSAVNIGILPLVLLVLLALLMLVPARTPQSA